MVELQFIVPSVTCWARPKTTIVAKQLLTEPGIDFLAHAAKVIGAASQQCLADEVAVLLTEFSRLLERYGW